MTVRSEIDQIALAAIQKELPGLRAALQRQLSARIASRITHVLETKRDPAFLRELKRREREVAHRETRVKARVANVIKQLQEIENGEAQ
jgi:hypothetical protein